MREFRYDAISIGDQFHTKFIITPDLVKEYCESIDLDFKKENKVPSSILAIYKPWYNAFGGRVAQGTIHLKQKMEYFTLVCLDDELDVVVVVTDKYNKKGRDYLVHETKFFRNKLLCCVQTTVQIWALAQKTG